MITETGVGIICLISLLVGAFIGWIVCKSQAEFPRPFDSEDAALVSHILTRYTMRDVGTRLRNNADLGYDEVLNKKFRSWSNVSNYLDYIIGTLKKW